MGMIECGVLVYFVCAVLTAAAVSTSNSKDTEFILWLGSLWPIVWVGVVLILSIEAVLLCILKIVLPCVLWLGKKPFVMLDNLLNKVITDD